MEPIIRIPLFNFNIDDDKEIIKHYAQIKEAIKISNPLFHKILDSKGYCELIPKEKRTLRKYLIRGKYRATPFGKFAALGIGHHTKQHELPIKIKELIRPHHKNLYKYEQNLKDGSVEIFHKKFKLGYMMQVEKGNFSYWEFDYKDEDWSNVTVAGNNVLNTVYNYFEKNHFLNFNTFSSWFNTSDNYAVTNIWKALILQAFIILESTPNKFKLSNLYSSKITLDSIGIGFENKIVDSEKLIFETVIMEMGNFFTQYHSHFLNDVKILFQELFDDRQVPLKRFFEQSQILEALSNERQQNTTKEEKSIDFKEQLLSHFQLGTNEVDLSKSQKTKSLTYNGWLHLLIKKQGHNDFQLLDANNFLGMGYLGRFTYDTEILNYQKEIFKGLQSYSDTDLNYTDFNLIEKSDLQAVCSHQNVCHTTISFSDRVSFENSISWEDLNIYLQDNSFHLIHT